MQKILSVNYVEAFVNESVIVYEYYGSLACNEYTIRHKQMYCNKLSRYNYDKINN